jgi:hypothetical protein
MGLGRLRFCGLQLEQKSHESLHLAGAGRAVTEHKDQTLRRPKWMPRRGVPADAPVSPDNRGIERRLRTGSPRNAAVRCGDRLEGCANRQPSMARCDGRGGNPHLVLPQEIDRLRQARRARRSLGGGLVVRRVAWIMLAMEVDR